MPISFIVTFDEKPKWQSLVDLEQELQDVLQASFPEHGFVSVCEYEEPLKEKGEKG